jgi:FkbM family methyltransferase
VVSRIFDERIPTAYGRISVRAPDVPPGIAASLFWRLYESGEIRLIRRHLSGDYDLVELGSSLGLVACAASTKLAPNRKILCVEANAGLVPLLRTNLVRNCPRQYAIEHAAIDYSGQAKATLHVGDSNISSRVVSVPVAGGCGSLLVPARTLGDIVSGHALGDYSLVCDIEGAEAGILLEETICLKACREAVLELHATEYKGRGYSVEDLRAILIYQHGFNLVGNQGSVVAVKKGG